jgi:alpha-tubulin suppressor-like RCC1 family protein
MVFRPLLALALTSALAGCGGGAAAPDGGDGHLDATAGDTTDGGGGAAIVVDTPSGVTATESQDGHCDILEAVAAAARGRTVDECANPNGVTRIVLQAGATYPVRKVLRLSGATEIGIADGASGSATITAAPGFAVDTGDASSACLVSVTNGMPDVWLRDVTLTQSKDLGVALAGACVMRGSLGLRRVRVTGFQSSGVVATCLPASGCDHKTDVDQSTTLRVLGSLIDGNHSAGKGAGISSEGIGATVLVAHSAIVNNASDNDGGGIYLGGGWNTNFILGSTVSGNTTSGVGGGLLARFAEETNTYVHIIASTIAYNTAAGTGGGIEFEPVQVGRDDVSVFGSIVAGNYSLSSDLEWNINSSWAPPTDPPGDFNCVNGSLIYVAPGYPRPNDMGCTFDVRNPFLGPLVPMGGVGNLPLHPLLVGSPAVDAALNFTARDEQRDAWIDNVDPATPPADWTLFDPLVDGDGDGTAVRDLGAYERNDRWQTELLAVRAQGPSAHSVVTIPGGYDRGAGTTYAATSATNEFVTYALPIGEPGHYDVTIGARRDADAGKFQVAIATDPGGPWTALGTEQDGYSATGAFAALGPFTTPLFTAPGEALVRFTVTGKNPASSGYHVNLDFIEASKRQGACPVADLAAGGAHTCALTSTGGVRCWGGNASGQLGTGGSTDRPSPPAADLVTGAAAVATGASHTCVLSSADGGVRCWGGNASGQLGDGSTTSRATPPAAPVLSGVKAIAAGRAFTCALMTSGGVRCWGANESGQLGDGSTTDRPSPPSSDVLTNVQAIAAGGTHACALTNAGGVRCWGANGSGQLGTGTMDDRSTPPTSDVIGGIAAISTGDTHTCALTSTGGLRCWGHNGDAELGTGNYDLVLSPPSTDVLSGVKQVVASNLFTCALLTSGGVRCWGFNSHGEIGDDTALQVDRRSPATVDVLGGAASLAAGMSHVCARMTTGGLRCWGGNDSGQLGDGLAPSIALTPPERDVPGFAGTCE